MKRPMSIEQFEKRCAGTQFLRDLPDPKNPNPSGINRGYYNLILSIHHCKVYAVGLRPTRSFRLKHIKQYFGLKGQAPKLVNQLEELRAFLKSDEGFIYRR